MPTVRSLSKLSARVKRGAALLDAEVPGWASRVDLDQLDVAYMDSCPLGQVYGSFEAGAFILGLWGPFAASHGFRCDRLAKVLGLARRDYDTLTLLWAAEIILRRRKADARRLVAPPKAEVAPVLV